VSRTVDPTLPRDGTDLIDTASREFGWLTPRYRVTVLTSSNQEFSVVVTFMPAMLAELFLLPEVT
jgi:hypothetical protein